MAQRPGSDAGFTVIEVLVASVLLVGALLATLALVENGIGSTAVSKQRDVANAVAQEMLERATGGRNSVSQTTPPVYVDDLVDYRGTTGAVGPADRLALQMDPDGDDHHTQPTPATPAAGPPLTQPQTWTMQRKGTTYTVSYRACTLSDTVGGLYVGTAYDCAGPCTANCTTSTPPTNPPAACAIVGGGVTDVSPGTPIVHLQIQGVNGLNLCAGDLTGNVGLALCNMLGSGTLNAQAAELSSSAGSVTSALGRLLQSGVNSTASLSLCPPVVAGSPGLSLANAVGSSTRVSVTVAWSDQRGTAHTISQSTLVRRQA